MSAPHSPLWLQAAHQKHQSCSAVFQSQRDQNSRNEVQWKIPAKKKICWHAYMRSNISLNSKEKCDFTCHYATLISNRAMLDLVIMRWGLLFSSVSSFCSFMTSQLMIESVGVGGSPHVSISTPLVTSWLWTLLGMENFNKAWVKQRAPTLGKTIKREHYWEPIELEKYYKLNTNII